MKKHIIISSIGIIISIVLMAIFIPKYTKCEQLEKETQLNQLGYYDYTKTIDIENEKKQNNYSAIFTIPMLITSLYTVGWLLETLFKNENENKKNK